jgi:hypothetical protein
MSTTRIADLPNLSPDQSGPAFPADDRRAGFGASNTTYVPIPAHTNPFETGEPNFKLPSRDIPARATEYTHDEAVIANHIPEPASAKKYTNPDFDPIREMERTFVADSAPIRSKARRRAELFWGFVEKFQVPLVAGILFFIFGTIRAMNIMTNILKWVHAIGEDGAPTTRGLAAKGAMFALAMMAVCESWGYLIDELGFV